MNERVYDSPDKIIEFFKIDRVMTNSFTQPLLVAVPNSVRFEFLRAHPSALAVPGVALLWTKELGEYLNGH
jgi:hypothetical protein